MNQIQTKAVHTYHCEKAGDAMKAFMEKVDLQKFTCKDEHKDARIRVQQRIQERLIEMELSSPDYIAEHDSFESSTPMINLRNDVINIATQVLEQCINNGVEDYTIQLSLLHRMLSKESELIERFRRSSSKDIKVL